MMVPSKKMKVDVQNVQAILDYLEIKIVRLYAQTVFILLGPNT